MSWNEDISLQINKGENFQIYRGLRKAYDSDSDDIEMKSLSTIE